MNGAVAFLLSRRVVPFVVVFGVLASVVVVAVRSEGSVATAVRLDDGAVWVANEGLGVVGRLNVRINELDLAVSAGAAQLLQDDRSVFYDGPDGVIRQINVETAQPRPGGDLPADRYHLGEGVGLALDPSGALWVGRGTALVGDAFPDDPDLVVRPGSRAVVTQGEDGGRGRVFIVDELGWYELALDAQLAPLGVEFIDDPDEEGVVIPSLDAVEREVLPGSLDEIVDLSAVGDRLVMLLDGGLVVPAGGEPIPVDGDQVVLQQPGPAASTVLVASTAGLFEIDLDGGDVERLAEASAEPAKPVFVENCVYGAWSGDTPVLHKRCGDQVQYDQAPIPGAPAGSPLIFRVNGRSVALNAPVEGGVWIERDGEWVGVTNWADVLPDVQGEPDAVVEGDEVVEAERECQEGSAAVPVAGDDDVGARPRQTILDVLYNDDDLNCEPIAVISVDPPAGEWGQLTIIDDGQHLLYSPSEEMRQAAQTARETFNFAYTVSDAAGNVSTPATVTVTVKARSVGDAPPQLRVRGDGTPRQLRTEVEEGRSVEYDVLADFWDPDGDDLRVLDALPESEGEVTATSDGFVRYRANGVSPSVQSVRVQVSDGERVANEPMEVTVQPAGSVLAPTTADDFLTIAVGEEGVVRPLSNDSDPNESTLRFIQRWTDDDIAGLNVRLDGDAILVQGDVAGRYRLDYDADDGDLQTRGSIIVTVRSPADENTAPVAVPDTVVVREGRIVNVDVLANDIDPDGDLLAISDARAAELGEDADAIEVSVVDRRLIQLVVPVDPAAPPRRSLLFSYTVTDGRAADRGEQTIENEAASSIASIGTVTVVIEPPTLDQPPVAEPDRAVVRSGDVVVVRVLDNDADPDGDQLQLTGIDQERVSLLESEGRAVAWVDGRSVLVQGGTPGEVVVPYTLVAGGVEAASELVVTVVGPIDGENPNQAPDPPDLELRAIRDGRVRLQVPTTGVDPDGDTVILLEQFPDHAQPANRIELDPDDPGTIMYTAGATTPALDSFSYVVEDRFGQRARGSVRVVIIDDNGAPPVANDDVLRGRPGRTLSIDTLANDASPQDRQLSLADLPFFDVEGRATDEPRNPDAVRVLDQSDPERQGRINVKVPDEGLKIEEQYRITDRFGGASASILVTGDPEVPNVEPVANLDQVEPGDLVRGEPVEVAVLANDFDPDDATGTLALTVAENQRAETNAAGDGLLIEVDDDARTVIYRITDQDGGIGTGRVEVPGLQNHPPELRDDFEPVVEAGGDALTLTLEEMLVDPDGDTDIELTAFELVPAGPGSFQRVGDAVDRFNFTPPPELGGTQVATVRFEVTDRPGVSENERQLATCRCIAQLELDVLVNAATPPRIIAEGTVRVPQLDDPAPTYDLTSLVANDDGDPLTFELIDPDDDGPSVVLDPSGALDIVSTLSGDALLTVGRVIPIRFSVSDGDFPPVEGRVNAVIVATNRGQPTTGTFPTLDAVLDEPLPLPDLLGAASNPFPDRPLSLVNVSSDQGGVATCDSGDRCTFVAPAPGTFTVTYIVEDAVQQRATGTVTIVAKGPPLQPGVPVVEETGNNYVLLSWTAPDPQGGTIEGYTVHVFREGEGAASRTVPFDSPGGRVEGLENAIAYRFAVDATNEIGVSERSDQSSIGIPDRIPSPPENLRFVDYGDGDLTIEWDPPSDAADYSEIVDYQITLGSDSINTGGATRITVGGLVNGQAYPATVRARNSAPTDNGWGAWSDPIVTTATEWPARFPDPPTDVAVANSGDGGPPRLTVTWAEPAFDGGRPITGYEVCSSLGECQNVPSGSTTATFSAGAGDTQTFTVIAINGVDVAKGNQSVPSDPSNPVTPIQNPATPTLTFLVVTSQRIQTGYVLEPPTSGCSTEQMQFRLDGGSWTTSGIWVGLTNGQTYTIEARRVLPQSCDPTTTFEYTSGISDPVTATPYGPLVTPEVFVSRVGTSVSWAWNPVRSNDGRPDWQFSRSGDCVDPGPGATILAQNGSSSGDGSISINFGDNYGPKNCVVTVEAATGPAPNVLTADASTVVPRYDRYRVTLITTNTTPPDCAEGFLAGDNDIRRRNWVVMGESASFGTPVTKNIGVGETPVISGEIWDADGSSADDRIARFSFVDNLRNGTMSRGATENFNGCSSTLTYSVEYLGERS